MLGKIVKLQHTQSFDKRGNVVLRGTKPVYVPIVRVYADGETVMLAGSFDTWRVVASKDSKAAFETASDQRAQ